MNLKLAMYINAVETAIKYLVAWFAPSSPTRNC